MMKGWKTVAIGLLMVIAPGALTYLAGVDWTSLVGPTGAFMISGILMIALRMVTTTPIGKAAPPVVVGGPSSMGAGAKLGAILLALILVGMYSQAWAADVAKPKLALPAYVATPCTTANCTGAYVGFNFAGIATNANVLAGGINGSVAGGGQNIGIQGGYQFWNGTWFFGPEVGIDYTYGGTIVPGGGVPKWLGYEVIKFGMPISTFFGGITPANPTGLPALLVNNTISPYLFVGAAQRNWGTGIASGGGLIFLIPDLAAAAGSPASGHWFLDARYMNVQYTGSQQANAIASVPQENLVMIGLNYKF